MHIILSISDNDMLKNFLNRHKIEHVARFLNSLENRDIIMFANVNNQDITSLIVFHLIDNIFYIENIICEDDFIEVGNIIRFATDFLKREQLATSIIFDNYPYNYNISNILLSCGYKCHIIEYEFDKYEKVYPVRRNLEINLKNNEVLKYMYDKNLEVIKSVNLYIGKNDIQHNINLKNTNTLVAVDNKKIEGVLRFSLVNDAIMIDELYADNVEIYVDLVNMIKNLTNKKIEISVYPIRRDLIEALNILEFQIKNADFFVNL